MGLPDEIAVIDSGSTDDTYDVARRAGGAVVHRAADIRPDVGSPPGRGEAHVVPGLLGPLLDDPSVSLVTGCHPSAGPLLSGAAS